MILKATLLINDRVRRILSLLLFLLDCELQMWLLAFVLVLLLLWLCHYTIGVKIKCLQG